MKKKICKIISAVVTVLMIFTSIPVFASEPQTVTNWESKVSEELLEVMSTKSDTDLIPVYVWLNDIDHDVIHEAMIEEKGMNPAAYENEEIFQKEIVPEIEAKIVARVGYEKAHAKVENSAYVLNANGAYHDETMSLVDRAIQAKTNEYIMAKRSISKREHSALVDEFIEEHVNEDRKLISVGEYVTYIIVEATKEEIKEYALLQEVEDVSLFVNYEFTTDVSTAIDQVDAGYSGTKGTSYNSGSGLKGTGIKIGVIETGSFDPTCPHLAPIVDTRLFLEDVESTTISDHASVVTSIIVGQPVTVDNVTYEGVVPLATVYQTTVLHSSDISAALTTMADNDVTVINMSLGIRDDSECELDEYANIDRLLDNFIYETSISCIKSAGNVFDEVSSPGKAFNIITVGNAETINSSFDAMSGLYSVNTTSSYIEAAYLPNKPDVCAPGTRIRIVKNITGSNNFYYDNGVTSTGTSFSAPIVSGIVAQIHQVGGLNFKLSAGLTKSVLITGADYTAIRNSSSIVPDEDNFLMGDFLWDKSGAGLVNAAKAVDIAMSSSQRAIGTSASVGYTYTSGRYYFTAGQHLRATLVLEKEYDGIVEINSDRDNLDLFFIDANGNEIFYNTTQFGNVIIIEGIIPVTGYYRFKMETVSLATENMISLYYSWITN